MYDYCLSCAQPAFEYFKAKFHSDLQIQLNGFKAARLFDPVKVCELQPTGVDINDLKVFSFFAPPKLEGLKVELPVYLAKANGVSADIDKLQWWQIHMKEFPKWASACSKVLLVQPSSAAAERVFSLLVNSFNDRQTCSLEDYIESSIMLQYNNK